jgi:three-Cys-motif partner protein
MVANKKFFDHLHAHSEVKLRILRKFITPWAAKLGFKVRRRQETNIWYVDGFAGPGRYADGSEGSPLIGAIRAQEALRKPRGHILGCINVEVNAARFAGLERNTHGFRDAGVPIRNLRGAFSDLVPDILAIVGPSAPLLAFIDPFGISPLDFQALKPMLRRRGEIDLILTFQTSALHRLVVDHPHLVTRAIGSEAWLHGWAAERENAVLEVLSANLKGEARFVTVVRYPIREEKESAVKYHLLMASRHYDAFQLLNNAVCDEERALDIRSYVRTTQATFLPAVDEEAEEQKLVAAIVDYGNSRRRTNRKEIREHLVLNSWGSWVTREIDKAVSVLIRSGRVKRLAVQHIDTDQLEFA